MHEILTELLFRREEVLTDIADTFSIETLLAWANQVKECESHEEMDLLESVRRITYHPMFSFLEERLLKSGEYLIPDASWEFIPWVEGDIPRALSIDAGMLAKVMVYSRMVDHGLEEQELKDIYLYHCLRIMVKAGRVRHMNDVETIKILHYYINRIASNLLNIAS